MFKSFSKNTAGTDYICSDIHGHFYLLEEKMRQANFNPDTDRIFSLGDLIDRGEDSHLVLDWLAKPWFYAVQGNHERMLINAVESESNMLAQQWFAWGGDWAEDLCFDELAPYFEALSVLPVAIELEVADEKKVGLVHAELPDQCDWLKIVNLLSKLSPDRLEANLEVSNMLWKKTQARASIDKLHHVEPVKNISHVFHGHTIVEKRVTIQNRSFIDFGSYETGEIAFLNVNEFIQKLDV